MSTPRSVVAASLALVVCLPVAVGAIPASAADTDVAVSKVTIDPTVPAVDESFEITSTIEVMDGGAFTVEDVGLRTGASDDSTLLNRTQNPGKATSSVPLDVTLSTSLDSPGEHTLFFHVTGTTADGERLTIRYPVTVLVGTSHPQVAVDGDKPVANTESAINVTVANGLPESAQNVQVTVSGETLTVERPQRVRASIASGSEVAFGYTVIPESPGRHTVNVTITYTTADGENRSVTRTRTLTVADLEDDVSLSATTTETNGTRVLEVTVANRGNAPAENLYLSATSDDATVESKLVGTVPAGESTTVTLPVSEMDAAEASISVDAEYDVGRTDGTSSTEVTVKRVPGVVDLTGVNVVAQNGKLHVTGSASNLGLDEVNSVVVGVEDTDRVSPSQPSGKYFVGTIPGSDFVSFDVYATVDGNVSEIPLRVSYLLDGDRHERVVTVPVEAASVQVSGERVDHDSGGSPGLLLVGAGVFVVLVGAVALVWRRRRVGD